MSEKKSEFWCNVCNMDMQHKNCFEMHLMGKKHKRAAEWTLKKELGSSHGIYVRGFPKWARETELRNYFAQFGEIKEVLYRAQPNKGQYLIVEFVTSSSAQACLDKKLFYGKYQLHVAKRKYNDWNLSPKKPLTSEEGTSELDWAHILAALSSCDHWEAQLAVLMSEVESADTNRFAMIIQHLEATFRGDYPACKAYPFGSTVTGLAFKGSDMDIYMDLNLVTSADKSTTQELQAKIVNEAKWLMYRSPMQFYRNIISIPKAKTPIVKFVHLPTKTSCDLSFKNALGVRNSALIKHYISLDERLKPVLVILKHWVKRYSLSGPGRLTHYALVMLVLFYLQQLSPPIVPPVYSIRSNDIVIDGWACGFNPRAWSPQGKNNSMSVQELVIGFLKFYSCFEYGLSVICPLIGESLAKSLFQFPEQLPEAMDTYKSVILDGSRGLRVQDTDMCVQDPFELTHNLTTGISQKNLEIFKMYCTMGAKFCEETLSSESDGCFLRKLFDDKIYVDKSASSKVKFSCIKIPFRKNQNWTILEEDKLRQWWYTAVFEVVLETFTQILKFDIKLEDEAVSSDEATQSLRKVQKLEGQADVSKQCLDICDTRVVDTKKFSASGKYRVWDGRKAAFRQLEFADVSDPYEKEVAMSDFVVRVQHGETAVNTFSCVCVFKKNPTEIELQIVNATTAQGNFLQFIQFLQRRFAYWVELKLSKKVN